MPAPEPTWAQKAQRYKEQLDGCHDQLDRFRGVEHELTEANQRILQMEKNAVNTIGLQRQIEFHKREAQIAQQGLSDARVRVQQVEKALRELKPLADMLPVVEEQAAIAQERARAADLAAQEARRQLAGTQQRLQQFQAATVAMEQMQKNADHWHREAVRKANESNELRQELSAVPEMQRELRHLREKLRLAGDHIQRAERKIADLVPTARLLPTVKADLEQRTDALERAQRRVEQLERALEQARVDREELATLRRSSAHQAQRLLEADDQLQRKQHELDAANAKARRLSTKLDDLRGQL